MKKYRISFTARVTQVVELFAENDEQAEESAERISQIPLYFVETDTPDLKHLVSYYPFEGQTDNWEVEYVEEFV